MTRTHSSRLALAAAVWSAAVFSVAPAFGQARPPGQAAAAEVERADPNNATAAPAPLKERRLPELKMDGVAFVDVINFLRDVDPTFQAVLSYAPGVDRSEPIIQELRLKDMTSDAVLTLLGQAYPQIQVEPTAIGGSSTFVIRVDRDPRVRTREAADVQPNVTSVHRLREIVNELSDQSVEPGERKKALEGVLSLLQAAMESMNPGPGKKKPEGVSLKLHEATETLVFNGPRDAGVLVRETLSTLLPTPEQADAGLRQQLDHLQQHNTVLERELEALRQKLRAAAPPASAAQPPAVPAPQPE